MFPAVAARSTTRGARLLSNFAKRTLKTDSKSGQAAAASQIQAGKLTTQNMNITFTIMTMSYSSQLIPTLLPYL